MARCVLELRQRFWRSQVTLGMGIVFAVLGVLGVLFPPPTWWEYPVVAAVFAFMVWLTLIEVRRAWVAVDESSAR